MSAALDALAPLPAPAGTDPQRVADAITAEARTSFATGMRVLTKPRRNAMRAIYAFARVIDDITDADWSLAEKHRLLDSSEPLASMIRARRLAAEVAVIQRLARRLAARLRREDPLAGRVKHAKRDLLAGLAAGLGRLVRP